MTPQEAKSRIRELFYELPDEDRRDLVTTLLDIGGYGPEELAQLVPVPVPGPAVVSLAPGTNQMTPDSDYSLTLVEFGSDKPQVIRFVRDTFNVPLLQAKRMVDSVPCLLFEALFEEEANRFKVELEKAGATVRVAKKPR